MLHGGVLPAVGVLELEVGQRAETAVFQAGGVVLAQVHIGAEARSVFQQQAFVAVLARDDVDDARDGVAAIQGGGCALDDLYLLDVLRVDQREVVLAAHVAVDALAVDQDEDVAVAQAAELHVRSHVVFIEGERGGQAGKNVLQGAAGIVLQHSAGDDFGLYGHVFQQVERAGGRDHGLRNRILLIRLRCQHLDQAQGPSDDQNPYNLHVSAARLLLNACVFPIRAGLLAFPGLLRLPGLRLRSCPADGGWRSAQWRFRKQTLIGDHSCRYSPGFAPGSLASAQADYLNRAQI